MNTNVAENEPVISPEFTVQPKPLKVPVKRDNV